MVGVSALLSDGRRIDSQNMTNYLSCEGVDLWHMLTQYDASSHAGHQIQVRDSLLISPWAVG